MSTTTDNVAFDEQTSRAFSRENYRASRCQAKLGTEARSDFSIARNPALVILSEGSKDAFPYIAVNYDIE